MVVDQVRTDAGEAVGVVKLHADVGVHRDDGGLVADEPALGLLENLIASGGLGLRRGQQGTGHG